MVSESEVHRGGWRLGTGCTVFIRHKCNWDLSSQFWQRSPCTCDSDPTCLRTETLSYPFRMWGAKPSTVMARGFAFLPRWFQCILLHRYKAFPQLKGEKRVSQAFVSDHFNEICGNLGDTIIHCWKLGLGVFLWAGNFSESSVSHL